MSTEPLNIGVVGATGVVGETFLGLMQKRNTPVNELRPFASKKSEGKALRFNDKEFELRCLTPRCFDGLDIVFFSSGDDISKEWAPKAVEEGAFAIDNSAAFRMSPHHKLIVPEVNGDLLKKEDGPQLIANPNCSTIQLVVALNAFKDLSSITSLHVASYQAVSGAGKEGLAEYNEQIKSASEGRKPITGNVFPHPIVGNCIPHIGSFNDLGFCSEEMKIMNETKKILRNDSVEVSAFCVRVPVENSHSEAVWVEFSESHSKKELEAALNLARGVTYTPQVEAHLYPTAVEISGKNDIYVGRLHSQSDPSKKWIMWIVGDNLLKGAALNGLQIAEKLYNLQ